MLVYCFVYFSFNLPAFISVETLVPIKTNEDGSQKSQCVKTHEKFIKVLKSLHKRHF